MTELPTDKMHIRLKKKELNLRVYKCACVGSHKLNATIHY